MKIGDVLEQKDSNGNFVFKLKVLEIGKHKTKCLVLASRCFDLIGNEEMWSTRTLKELQGSEFYYTED